MSSLLTGVTGLNVNQQMLDVAGNNLANSNTTGYKDQVAQFGDLVYQTLSPGSAATATTGTLLATASKDWRLLALMKKSILPIGSNRRLLTLGPPATMVTSSPYRR